mgnify:FL=1
MVVATHNTISGSQEPTVLNDLPWNDNIKIRIRNRQRRCFGSPYAVFTLKAICTATDCYSLRTRLTVGKPTSRHRPTLLINKDETPALLETQEAVLPLAQGQFTILIRAFLRYSVLLWGPHTHGSYSLVSRVCLNGNALRFASARTRRSHTRCNPCVAFNH